MLSTPHLRIALLTAVLICSCNWVSAQTDKETDHNNWQEKMEQQPPQSTQKQTERAIRRADPNNAARRNDSAQAKKIKKVKERATGQPAKNPATEPPHPVLTDPVYTPRRP